jgi:hypothetical protein
MSRPTADTHSVPRKAAKRTERSPFSDPAAAQTHLDRIRHQYSPALGALLDRLRPPSK